MDTDSILDAMIMYGGSFVAGLGRLYLLADDVNRGKLRVTFANYFAEYAEIAKLQSSRISER